MHINRNTINAYYNEIREKILHHSLKEQAKELGEFELDESYFGARRVCGKRGRGAAGKTPVFGLLKGNGNVRDGCAQVFERKIDAYCSRENPGGVDDSHRWLKGLRQPYFERLQSLPSIS